MTRVRKNSCQTLPRGCRHTWTVRFAVLPIVTETESQQADASVLFRCLCEIVFIFDLKIKSVHFILFGHSGGLCYQTFRIMKK